MYSNTDKETLCEWTFKKNGKFWHLCTNEDFPVIFKSESEFMQGMAIIAYCSLLFPDMKVLTFALMSNHVHIVLCAERRENVELYFRTLKKYLRKTNADISGSFDKWQPYIADIQTLDTLRNTIAYVNRNGYVAYCEYLPFSYPWSAGKFMFNPMAVSYHKNCARKMKSTKKRDLIPSRNVDKIKDILELNGIASPLCFCDIALAESVFRDPRQYFIRLAKNVESARDIAAISGCKVLCTDEELFLAACNIAKSEYGCSLQMLPPDAKLEMMKKLHYDYCAGNKQIARIVRADINTVNVMFPLTQRPK